MTNPYAYKIKPKGFMLRILRVDQAAAAPILDGGLVYDRLEDHTDPPHGVPMVETEPLHGLVVMPWRLWTTTRADRPAVNALGVFWLRGTSPNPARWRLRYWRRLAQLYVADLRRTVWPPSCSGRSTARRLGDRLVDLLFLLLATVVRWLLLPAWVDRRLPVRDAPVRASNAHRNGVGVPARGTVIVQNFTTPTMTVDEAHALGHAVGRQTMRGFRGGFDA